MLQGIVFDMDGVLFDTEILYNTSFRLVAKEMHIDEAEKLIKECVGLNHNDMRLYIEANYPGVSFETFMKKGMEIFNGLLERGIPLKEGTKEILTYLGNTDLKIGLASSSTYKIVMENLVQSGLTSCFRVVIGGDMVTHSKPKPDIYLKACKELGIEPQHSIAVEDSINGIKSAYSAGLKAVMIPDMLPPTEEIKPMIYQKFDSLLDLKQFLIEDFHV